MTRLVVLLTPLKSKEFYEVQSNPDSLNNLISNNTLQPAIDDHRRLLLDWMEKHQDPVLPVLQMRHIPEFLLDMLEASYPDRNSLTPPGQVVRDARTKARHAAYLEKQVKKGWKKSAGTASMAPFLPIYHQKLYCRLSL